MYFIFFFSILSLKAGVCFTLMTHLSSHTDYSSEVLDLYLGLIKFTIEKIDSHTKLF